MSGGPANPPGPRRGLRLGAMTLLAATAVSAIAAFAAQSRQPVADPETLRLDSRALPATVETYWQGTAACLRPPSGLDSEIAAGVARMTRFSPPDSRTIRGLRFENRPRILLDAFEALVGRAPASKLAVAADCATVSCALARIFGQREGDRILFLYLRYNYNASHLADPDAVAWDVEELSDLILALGDFPGATIPFHGAGARLLLEEAKGDKLAAAAGLAPNQVIAVNEEGRSGGIRVGPNWERQPQPARRAAIFHEVAHDYFRVKANEANTLRLWQGAMLADTVWARNTRRPLQVSQYAATSVPEDFAESAVAYRYAPELLKVRAPRRYDLLRRSLFDGLEYTSEGLCAPQRSYTSRALTAAQALMSFSRLSEPEATAAMTACFDVAQAPGGPHKLTVGRACMGREVLRATLRANLALVLAPNDPVDRELLVDRLSNDPFLIDATASLAEEDLLQATSAARRAECGVACHTEGGNVRRAAQRQR
ncbi:MAG: hypothetical protein INF91_07000 [Alphaproteobacteria bacterium]|nr:hypothetical protein [Alphaproteobacteria bacterium]